MYIDDICKSLFFPEHISIYRYIDIFASLDNLFCIVSGFVLYCEWNKVNLIFDVLITESSSYLKVFSNSQKWTI